jgi:hypothetical protein
MRNMCETNAAEAQKKNVTFLIKYTRDLRERTVLLLPSDESKIFRSRKIGKKS